MPSKNASDVMSMSGMVPNEDRHQAAKKTIMNITYGWLPTIYNLRFRYWKVFSKPK